jgi:IBR domain, a half RING-finger domain/SAM domain (Sterile alpha motif)/Zinc finger, C3HC4 type (RING finger)
MQSSKPPCQWGVIEVEDWARSVKLSEETISKLVENEVDGPTLAILTKEELQTELGIRSLPARRHLWDLIQRTRTQQNKADFFHAVDIHRNEIYNLKSFRGSDVYAGGKKIDDEVISVLSNDAEIQRQILEDHLLALRLDAGLSVSQYVYEDYESAREEQRRLDKLIIQSEYDHQYAATLDSSRRTHRSNLSPEVKSLFGLSIDACVKNKINVAEALEKGEVEVFNHWKSFDFDDKSEKPSKHESNKNESNIIDLDALPVLKRCNVCYDESVKGLVLACEHPYCIDCLRNVFRSGLRDVSLLPLRCCELPIDTTICHALLSEDEANLLARRIEESEATRKMYCPKCEAFINLDRLDSTFTEISCDCGAPLCAKCESLAHPGQSCLVNKAMTAKDDHAVIELAAAQGWKQCPNCSNIIEFISGCNHMTCRCGHGFCYLCLRPWDNTNGMCSTRQCAVWSEDRLVVAAQNRVDQQIIGRNVPQNEIARRVQVEMNALEHNEQCAHQWVRRNMRHRECERCSFYLWSYGMVCHGGCRSVVCYTCAHHRIPQRGWR